ncbi:hypothetical protein EMCRGX_G000336 [Ephydatia muelleri]
MSQQDHGSGQQAAEAGQLNGNVTHCIDIQAASPGNPVFTCDLRFTLTAGSSIPSPKTKEPYSVPQHPLFITTSSSYGELQPTLETTPLTFHGKSQKFTEHLMNAGMFKNNSLNTSMESSRV